MITTQKLRSFDQSQSLMSCSWCISLYRMRTEHNGTWSYVEFVSALSLMLEITVKFWWMESLLVRVNKINQYTTKTGQKTGTSKIENHVQTNPIAIALVAECQNLNSGRRRMKGRNSSSCFVGSPPAAPSSISLSMASLLGSNLGWRKARNRLSR